MTQSLFNININQLHWNNETATFSEEASTLKMHGWPDTIKVFSPKSMTTKYFNFEKFDFNGAPEDQEIAGANYKTEVEGRTIRILIIND